LSFFVNKKKSVD